MINEISLKNYRRFNNLKLDINKQFVIITGDNAVGKTSVLESIYLASVTKSLKTSNISELIKFNQEYTFVNIRTNISNYRVIVSLEGKKLLIDKHEIKKSSEYIGKFKSVFFTPSELDIINGNPNNRRLFLNLEISQLDNKYLKVLNEYNQVLKERNKCLKNMVNPDLKYLKIITRQLNELAIDIMKSRLSFIDNINKSINTIHQKFNSDEILRIEYKNSLPFKNSEDFLMSKLDKDISLKTTSYGIHRDDLIFYINDEDTRNYASQGQKRSCILSLKICLCLIIRNITKIYPVLLLDDVLSELDKKRQNSLLNIVLNLGQTFVSVTDLEGIDLDILKQYQIIKLERGVEE